MDGEGRGRGLCFILGLGDFEDTTYHSSALTYDSVSTVMALQECSDSSAG